MTDFDKLKTKVADLKAKVEQNSISPAYLGALLDDFINAMAPIAALSNITESLRTVKKQVTDLNDTLSEEIRTTATALGQLAPVACADEADLLEKAKSDKYGVGQQFYIPEND